MWRSSVALLLGLLLLCGNVGLSMQQIDEDLDVNEQDELPMQPRLPEAAAAKARAAAAKATAAAKPALAESAMTATAAAPVAPAPAQEGARAKPRRAGAKAKDPAGAQAVGAAAAKAQGAPAAAKRARPAASNATDDKAPKPAAPVAAKEVKVVAVAPAAVVENGDDINPRGPCADVIPSTSCNAVEVGEGRLAECISQIIAALEAAQQKEETVTVPDACEADVYDYYVKRSKNINANVPLATACKADAERLCNSTWFFGGSGSQYQPGGVVACLREVRDKVSNRCRAQLRKAQAASARDYRADPSLRRACKGDAEKLCADVKQGGGRKQACLRDNHLKLSWECAEQLFRQELEADDDIRLSVRLYQRCLGDKKRFCPDSEPGHAAAKDCLLARRNDKGFSEGCRNELESMMERRVRDFRLDSRLRKYCADDIVGLCGAMEAGDGDNADVNICLQDYIADIRNDQCRALVKQYQELAAQDIRFDVPLADACYDDRHKLCGSVPPGSARVIRCLQSRRDALSRTCRATLFDEEVWFSENIDFQYPMKQACAAEVQAYCAKMPHGNARVIRCLQNNKRQRDFGRQCLKEVLAYEQRASSDYRLNHRLRTTCHSDIAALCKDSCRAKMEDQVCGGAVLRCLTDKQDGIKSAACRKEVFYFTRMQVEDFHNDVILAAACRGDVERLCKGVEPGNNGGVHACLRQNRAKLSETCRKEELLLEQAEAEHIELRPALMKACSNERGLFCKDVEPGNGRVFRCLAEKLADPDFGPVCRGEVIMKVHRRQANWKLDPPLRKACRADVSQLCHTEDEAGSEGALVYKCLIGNSDDLAGPCRKELGRAVHMAFFVWMPGGLLTSPCDVDVSQVCLKDRPNMVHQPGQVGACLADALERIASSEAAVKAAGAAPTRARAASAAADAPSLSEECRSLADVAEPPDMRRAFEESLAVALLGSQLAGVEARTGVAMLARDAGGRARGVTLSGWSAVIGVAALIATLLAGASYAWRRWRGGPSGATVVLKARHQGGYRRVGAEES